MEKIIIKIKDRSKARALLNFLASLDFIDAITSTNLPTTEKEQTQLDADFFALAGLWAGRSVSIEDIREKAWPQRL